MSEYINDKDSHLQPLIVQALWRHAVLVGNPVKSVEPGGSQASVIRR
ncbi:hypothetical protein [Idiomarina sp. UBA3176]|nr:hypothetical protein [Idiomarina sp. UBA3176]